MASTISPNMNLILPTVGQEPGPDYGYDQNNSFTLIDQHDHTPGKGVQITPAGLNINDSLPFNNNFATQLAGLSLLAQSVTPGLSTVYQSGVDLYFVDGVGNNVRLTQSGGVAGTPGSITNLVFPASANYVAASSTFVWQSDVNIAANMDFASAIFRNISPNSTYALTLAPPSGLASNYNITLPTLPSVQSFMTLDSSGVMAAPWTVDDSTIKIVANQLVAQKNVLSVQKEHAWELNGNFAGLTSPLLNLDSIFLAPANLNITSIWIYQGDAGTNTGGLTHTDYDLLVASPGGSFTSILSTTGRVYDSAAAAIWTDSGSVVAPQAGIRKPVISTAAISAGQAIKFDLTWTTAGTAADARIRIFYSLS